MTDKASVTVEGDDELAASLRRAADEIAEPTRALDNSGRIVEQRARAGAPVDTGALARSIHATRQGVEVHVGPTVGIYAAVQEYGSSHTPAHPYLRPALDYSERVVTGLFLDDTNKALAKVEGA